MVPEPQPGVCHGHPFRSELFPVSCHQILPSLLLSCLFVHSSTPFPPSLPLPPPLCTAISACCSVNASPSFVREVQDCHETHIPFRVPPLTKIETGQECGEAMRFSLSILRMGKLQLESVYLIHVPDWIMMSHTGERAIVGAKRNNREDGYGHILFGKGKRCGDPTEE